MNSTSKVTRDAFALVLGLLPDAHVEAGVVVVLVGELPAAVVIARNSAAALL